MKMVVVLVVCWGVVTYERYCRWNMGAEVPETWSHDLCTILGLSGMTSDVISRPDGQGLGLGLKTASLVPTLVARLPLFVAPLSECCVTNWNWCSQCCDLETMVSRLECTRVHFVLVSVSRHEDPGLGLGLETWWPRSRSWCRDLKKVFTTTLGMTHWPR